MPTMIADSMNAMKRPVDALVLSALGRPVVNAAPAELGARTTELVAAAYRSIVSGTPQRIAQDPTDGDPTDHDPEAPR